MVKIIKTDDGSHTLKHGTYDETYHSTHGAVAESSHVFIEAGLNEALKKNQKINILEIGLGTGLNAFLTFLKPTQSIINYTALEPYPISAEVFNSLNYPEILDAEINATVFKKLHECEWDKCIEVKRGFYFTKRKEKVQDVELPSEHFHLIYFDAFSPKIQPELWSWEIFEKMYKSLVSDGILVTYCAKGQVKRNLKAAGFILEGLPGPKGKREITRGIKNT